MATLHLPAGAASVASILLAILPCIAPAAVAEPMRAPATRPAQQAWEKAIDEMVRGLDVSQFQADVDAAYPRLRRDAVAMMRAFDARPTVDPRDAARHELAAVVLPKVRPDLARYLNFWYRADLLMEKPQGHYPANAFDKVTEEPPRGQAYVIFRAQKGHTLVRFTQGREWQDTGFASMEGAVRLGAALALMQDALEAIRDGKDTAAFVAAPGVKWTYGKPAMWVVIEQTWRDGGIGLIPLQSRLDSPTKTAMRLALWVREDNARNLGLHLHLVSTPHVDKYLGWRIDNFEKVPAPRPEPAD